MSKSSKAEHASFLLSEEISKNRKVQVAVSVLLLAVLGLQVYTLVGAMELFQASML